MTSLVWILWLIASQQSAWRRCDPTSAYCVGLTPDQGKRIRYQAIVIAAMTETVPPRLHAILDGQPERGGHNFAFLITDVVVPDGMPRVNVVGYLADAGIYMTEDGMVHGMGGSDYSRNERMILKVVAHLGDSSHKYNPVALSQLADA